MENKMKQAGFKSKLATARYFDVEPKTIYNWIQKPPKIIMMHLDLMIKCNFQSERIDKLESDLKVYTSYFEQPKKDK